MKDQWYHHAIIYALDVETFKDSNNDGIGDFEGLVSQLDYLSGLGINCIWLRPFYPSPLVDDGYDIMDYYSVDKRIGNLGDFVDFAVKANALGIRIIIDLVINHTSDRHHWFLESKKSKDSKFRDYYIWKEELSRKDKKHENMMGEGGIWEWDDEANAWYMHHFKKEQPDLNISNPDVREEIKKIMGFWLKLGISGFRIDAAHVIVHESKEHYVELLDEMREFLNSRDHEAILLAEADVDYEHLQKFFGKEKGAQRMHLLFNFHTNKNMFLALAKETAEPLITSLNQIQQVKGEWVNFLRHHDELNLEMLSEDEREEVYRAFAPDENMRMLGRGIRRRLAPMLDGDRKRMELINCTMFSLPGLPLVNYGEEIGMGDDLSQDGRSSVRTVMQWDTTKNAGFSMASHDKLAHPVVKSPDYGYHKVNVSSLQCDPDSFLNWMERLISTRKYSPQLSFGRWMVLENDTPEVLSFFYEWKYDIVIILLNFSNRECRVHMNTGEQHFENLTEIFSNRQYDKRISRIDEEVDLSPYGYRWFKSTIHREH